MPAPWDWQAFLQLASQLSPTSIVSLDDEARARTAISRAYYSAYHHAKEYVVRMKYKQAVGSRHDEVWNCLQERERSSDEKAAGVEGGTLMTTRQRADYRSPVKRLGEDLKFALAQAATIRTLLP